MNSSYFEVGEKGRLGERLNILMAIILALFIILALNLAFLQIGRGDYYRKVSRENSLRLVKEKAPRGEILDREKRIIVENKTMLTLSFIPHDLVETPEMLKTLSDILSLSTEETRLKLRKREGSPFDGIALKEGLTLEEAVKISEQRFKLPGIIIKEGICRSFPQKKLASHLIGYAGYSGVEREYNRYLEGVDGGKEIEVDARGNLHRLLVEKKSKPGVDLILTIDSQLQQKAEELLKDRWGTIICLNPQDGEVLAMASGPDYDPAIFAEKKNKEIRNLHEESSSPLLNRAIQGRYPPGSIFKVITAGAFLEEHLGDENTTLSCGGRLDLGGKTFSCWEEEGHGKINLLEALAYSCDVYFYQLGLKVGIDRLSHYARACGLGKATGIDLSYEEKGLVPSRTWKENFFRIFSQKRWYPGETVILAVGQGYLNVTPLQMAVLYAAIANNGTVYRPHLLSGLSPVATLPFSPHTLEIIRRGLYEVVNGYGERHGTGRPGTGHAARLAKVKVAGKTGTAQVVGKGQVKGRVPFEYQDHAWFCGFAPYDHPEIVVVALIEHGGSGAAVAAPRVKEIMEFYFDKIKKY